MDDWQLVLVTPETRILQAIEFIDKGAIGAVIVVDKDYHLLGVVTDGDVRRGILKDISLEAPVSLIMNREPKFAYQGDDKSNILALMKQFSLHHIPIVNQQQQVIRIEVLDDFVKNQSIDNPVVIMAGGFGTRLRPLTDHCPKPLLKIDNKPMLEIILEQFIHYGFHNFIFSLNYRGDMIKQHFQDGSNWKVKIDYLEEHKPLGTAGALKLLPSTLKKPFIVMNGDIMTQVNFQHLLEFHEQQQSKATLCVREYQQSIPYGVVQIDNQHLVALEEKPEQTFYINAGIYVLDPSCLAYLSENQVMDMPELIDRLINRKQSTAVFPIREYWLDIGKPDDFHQAHHDYKELFQC